MSTERFERTSVITSEVYPQKISEKQDVSGYKLINCGDDVKVGWIYADKTNVFVDSNSQA